MTSCRRWLVVRWLCGRSHTTDTATAHWSLSNESDWWRDRQSSSSMEKWRSSGDPWRVTMTSCRLSDHVWQQRQSHSSNGHFHEIIGKSIRECLHSYRNVPVLEFIGAKHDGGGGAVDKVVLWSRGEGLTWRSQVGANPIRIPTPLIWRYLGIK